MRKVRRKKIPVDAKGEVSSPNFLQQSEPLSAKPETKNVEGRYG